MHLVSKQITIFLSVVMKSDGEITRIPLLEEKKKYAHTYICIIVYTY